MDILLELFLIFFKIGLFTFGGGYAMIPLLTEETLSHAWLTESELLSFIAVAESTPGPVAINMATFIGSSQAGVIGALCATLGVVLPSFIIILLIASVITGLMKLAGVKAFLTGVRPVVVALIVGTGITIFLNVMLSFKSIDQSAILVDLKALLIFAIIVISNFLYKKIAKKAVPVIALIIFSAILGVIFYGLL